MMNQGFIYGIVIIVNFGLSSGTILSPLKVDPSSLHLYKTGLRNELDYILKRSGSQNVEETPDSKERRSQMGSSFIRFGRSRVEGNVESPDYSSNSWSDLDASSRIPRGRSDVIIRFGRAGFRRKLDSGSGRSLRLLPIDLQQLFAYCSDLTNSDPGVNDLARLCSSITIGSNEENKND